MPPSPATRARAALTGIALTTAACACFALLDVATKYVSLALPFFMALWLRYLFQALLTSAYWLRRHGARWPRTAHPRYQLLRALLFACTSLTAYLGLRVMPLAEFTAIVAATPLCVTLAAALWLRQRVGALRWLLVAVGLASVLIILRPGGEAVAQMRGWALLLPLAMLATGTGYQVLSSVIASQEDPAATQLYTSWLATALMSLGAPWVWTQVADPWVWAGTFVMGLASAAGHLMLLRAYAHTTAATIAPFLYSQIGFAMLAGWAFYSQVPDAWALLGMGLIAACGALGAWLSVREAR